MTATRASPRTRLGCGRFGVIATAIVLAALALAPAASARKLTLGKSGADVRHVQERLAELSYLPRGAASGEFDQRTWHAVVAFQGWQGMTPDGIVGRRTRKKMGTARRPPPSSRQEGFEIHLRAQVLLLVRNGRTARAIHVSSGAFATPTGHFSVYSRQVMSWSRPFKTWMPLAQYFVGGIALHQGYSVPAYPASHGCVRVPAEEVDLVWRSGRIGSRVWVENDHRVVRGPSREQIEERRAKQLRDRIAAAVSWLL